MLHAPTLTNTLSPIRKLEVPAVLSRICVRSPYFALHDLRFQTPETTEHARILGVLQATVRAENTPNNEIGPIQGAELSRHAAISGLCAAASVQSDDNRRYYLAREAWYEGFLNRAPYGTPVEIRAEVIDLDKRQARAVITATALDVPVCRLEVAYTILTEHTFERLFRSRRLETPELEHFGQAVLGQVERDGNAWFRRTSVSLESCAGHFQNYPAMPVAVLMHQLKNLAGLAMTGGQGQFRVIRAEVDAVDFCWAHEEVEFRVTPTFTHGAQMTFDCTVTASTRRAANMSVTLERMTD